MLKRLSAAFAAIAILCLPAGAVPQGQAPAYVAPVAKISRSVPTVTDDSSKGYAVGAIWTTRRTGAPTDAYTLTDATAGAAVWQKMQSGLLPGDALANSSGGVVGLYGSVLLNSSYTGPALKARRVVDGATKDIGFVVNGNGQKVLDVAAIQAFAMAGPAQGAVFFSGNPVAGDTVTLNGFTVTFVASGATGAQVNIGASPSITASNLATYLAAQTDTRLTVATYSSGACNGSYCTFITSAAAGGALANAYPMTQTGSGNFARSAVTAIPPTSYLNSKLTSSVTVNKWYDQSGSGNDASSYGAAYEPALAYFTQQGGVIVPTMNGLPVVSFDSQAQGSGGAYYSRFMVLPSTVTENGSVWSFWSAVRPSTTRRSNGFVYLGSFGSGAGVQSVNGVPSINLYGPTDANMLTPASPILLGASASSQANHSLYINNAVSTTYGSTALPTTTLTGGYLGIPNSISGMGETNSASLTQSPAMFDACAMVIVNRPLGSTEMAQMQASLAAACNIAPQIRDVYVLGGDSIDQGYGAYINRNYSTVLQEYLNRDYLVYNLAYYGTNTTTQLSEISTYFAKLVAENPYAAWLVYHTMIGTNDLTAGVSTATINGNISSIFSSVKTIAPAAVTVAETIPAQSGFTGGILTAWPAVNAAIKSLSVNAVIDIAGRTPLGNMSNTPSKVYFFDAVHPTTTGHEIRGTLAKPVIDALTPAVAPAP